MSVCGIIPGYPQPNSMKNRAQIAIGFLAIVLSFTLGYSLGNAEYTATEEFQGRLTEINEKDEHAPQFSARVVDESWNASSHGLEVTFEVENQGDAGVIGDYSVKTHLRITDGEKRINLIENAAGFDERTVESGETLMIQSFIPADAKLSSLVEQAGYEVKKLEVEL